MHVFITLHDEKVYKPMSAAGKVNVETETLGKAIKFIDDLGQEEKDTAYAMITTLEDPPYAAGLVKIVDKKNRIYEVRGSTKDFWIRLLWFYHKIPHEGKSKIVITNGCIKQQNKLDPKEIEIAKNIQNLYESKMQEEYKGLKKSKKRK